MPKWARVNKSNACVQTTPLRQVNNRIVSWVQCKKETSTHPIYQYKLRANTNASAVGPICRLVFERLVSVLHLSRMYYETRSCGNAYRIKARKTIMLLKKHKQIIEWAMVSIYAFSGSHVPAHRPPGIDSLFTQTRWNKQTKSMGCQSKSTQGRGAWTMKRQEHNACVLTGMNSPT